MLWRENVLNAHGKSRWQPRLISVMGLSAAVYFRLPPQPLHKSHPKGPTTVAEESLAGIFKAHTTLVSQCRRGVR